MPTKNKTSDPAQSSTRTGSRVATTAREDEPEHAGRTAANEINCALERWENEGGSASDVDTVAAQTGDPGRW